MIRYVTEAILASWLKLSLVTIMKWRRQGGHLPQAHCINNQYHYAEDELDAWLLAHCHHATADTTPTTQKFRDRAIEILTHTEVLARFAAKKHIVGTSTFYRQVRAHEWPVLELPNKNFRFFGSVVNDVADSLGETIYSVAQVAHMVGLEKGAVFALVQEGLLDPRRVFGSKETHVDEKSLLRLLDDWLRGDKTAEGWVIERMRSKRPVVSARRGSKMLHVHPDRIRPQLDERGSAYLLLPSGQIRVPAETISALRDALSPRRRRAPKPSAPGAQ